MNSVGEAERYLREVSTRSKLSSIISTEQSDLNLERRRMCSVTEIFLAAEFLSGPRSQLHTQKWSFSCSRVTGISGVSLARGESESPVFFYRRFLSYREIIDCGIDHFATRPLLPRVVVVDVVRSSTRGSSKISEKSHFRTIGRFTYWTSEVKHMPFSFFGATYIFRRRKQPMIASAYTSQQNHRGPEREFPNSAASTPLSLLTRYPNRMIERNRAYRIKR